MKKSFFLILITFLSWTSVSAQAEKRNWLMSRKNGFKIDINTGLPVDTIQNPLYLFSTITAVSDSSGNLLFSMIGDYAFDRNFNQIPGQSIGTYTYGSIGAGELRNYVLKLPGNNQKYLLYGRGNYNYLDLSLNNGLGGYTQSSITPIAVNGINFGNNNLIQFVPHCDGENFWLLLHEINTNNFLSFLIDSTGISSMPVVSSVGPVHTFSKLTGYRFIKNNTMFISCKWEQVTNPGSLVEFYDFDPATGVISQNNYVSFFFPLMGMNDFQLSDNEKNMYFSTWAVGTSYIYQLDISSFNPTTILNSLTQIYTFPPDTSPFGNNVCTSRLSKSTNGVILFVPWTYKKVGAILNPDITGPGCNVVDSVWTLQTDSSTTYGLSSFVINANIQTAYPKISHDGYDTVNICAGSTHLFQADTFTTYGWQWKLNGTDIPGATQSSYSATQPGVYQVQFISPTGCKGKTSKPITILLAPSPTIPGINYFSDTLFSTVSADSFSWSFNGNPINTDSFLPNPSPGVYILTIWNAEGCSASSTPFTLTHTEKEFTQNIRVYPNPTSGLVTIELPKPIQADYLITDINGKDCLKGSIPYNLMKANINLSSLPSGLYFIRLSSEQGYSVFRVLVE